MFKMNMEESNNGSKKLQIRNSTAEFRNHSIFRLDISC